MWMMQSVPKIDFFGFDHGSSCSPSCHRNHSIHSLRPTIPIQIGHLHSLRNFRHNRQNPHHSLSNRLHRNCPSSFLRPIHCWCSLPRRHPIRCSASCPVLNENKVQNFTLKWSLLFKESSLKKMTINRSCSQVKLTRFGMLIFFLMLIWIRGAGIPLPHPPPEPPPQPEPPPELQPLDHRETQNRIQSVRCLLEDDENSRPVITRSVGDHSSDNLKITKSLEPNIYLLLSLSWSISMVMKPIGDRMEFRFTLLVS